MHGETSDRVDAAAAWLLRPLDGLRALGLRALGRPLSPLIAQPSLRHAFFGGASILAAFTLTCLAPLFLLAFGPLVLGVPHLLADARYLVLRPGLLRRPWVMALMLAPLACAAVVSSVALAGAVLIGGGLAARGAGLRRLGVMLFGAALVALGVRFGRSATIIFAHLHNVLALAIWWSLRPARSARELVVPLLAVAGAAVLASGLLDERAWRLADSLDGDLSLSALISSLSPVSDPAWSLRFVLLFVFGQAVHYTVWLRLIPDDLRGRRAPRSFSASFRALRSELGAVVLLGVLAVWGGLMSWAAIDLDAAWRGYLQLATFHGPLEVACLGLAFAERRRP